ncbi:MAG TPA: AAA family ATPase, partial [Chloroflexota bacterium]|nr:AAA family ATPase [Chloroflexota bacterium]
RVAVSAPSFGESIPFSVLAAFVRALLFNEPARSGIGAVAIHQVLTGLLPDGEIEDAGTVLADVLGVATGEDAAVTRLEARSRLAILARSLERIVVALSERRPLLLVLDDMQWADAASLRVFDDLLAAVAGRRIMAVVIHRPEFDHDWPDLPSHRQIRLAEFEVEDAQAMVAQFLRAFGLEEMIGEKIVEKAGGNPFFLEQILNGLITSGAIVERAGSWQLVRDVSSITVPDTIQGVLLARLDRISQGARSVLEVAAVIGRVFAYHLLQTIVEAEQQLDIHLEQLRTQDFIFEKSVAPELEFMFRHSLTQDVVYGSLVAGKRRTFHLRVAQTIESLGGTESGEQFPLLAYHYSRTDEWEKAVEYSIAAAERARRFYANDDAVHHFEQALDFLERNAEANDPRIAQVLEALGDIHAVAGAHARAAEYYARVVGSQADPGIRGRVERKRGDLAQSRGSYAEARRAYRNAQAALEERGDAGELIAMWVGVARMNRSRGAVDDAASACRQALAIEGDAGDLVRGALYCELGEIERERGQYKTAARFFDEAAASFDCESAVERRAVASEGLAEVSLLSGRLQHALAQYDLCCDIYERVADRQRLANARLGVARARHRTGELEDAIDLLARALAAGTDLGDQLLIAWCSLELASIHLDRGDLDATQALADRSYTAFKRIRQWRGLAETQLLRARLSLARGDLAWAPAALDRARNLATEMGNTHLLAQVAMVRAAIHEASAEWDEAAAQERLAAGMAREIGDQVLIAETQRELGRILLRRGERGAGMEALVESITSLRRLGARLEAARAVLDYVSAASLPGNDVDVADMLQFALEALTTANVPDELQTAREMAGSMSLLPM